MPTVNISQGSTLPSVNDTLQVNGVIVDLTTASTVRFQMRRINGAVDVVDSSAVIVAPATAGTVRYDWASGDTAEEGEFLARWKVTFASGKVQQFPEFEVNIDAHAPGVNVVTGEIYNQAKQIMPVTWTALSKDDRYGDNMLMGRINYVKYKLFSTVVSPLSEATVYNPMVIDYIAKESALQIIPTGIDYWMDQRISLQTKGTTETATFPDRINALEKLHEWLLKEVRDLRPEIDGITVRRRGNVPKVSNDDQGVITPNPQDFGKIFGEGIPTTFPVWPPI